MDTKNTHLLLFSAAFLVLGFVLGRVTGRQAPRGVQGHGPQHLRWSGQGEAEVEVRMIADGEFEGDTAFELPGGGQVHVVRNGDEYEVEVDIDEDKEDAGKPVRVERRVIVVTEEQ
jgi:hypothetical protein